MADARTAVPRSAAALAAMASMRTGARACVGFAWPIDASARMRAVRLCGPLRARLLRVGRSRAFRNGRRTEYRAVQFKRQMPDPSELDPSASVGGLSRKKSYAYGAIGVA